MTAGKTTFADISARIPQIVDDSLAVARMANYLLPTVTVLSAQGMMNREVSQYSATTFATAGENDDTAPQKFAKSLLSTLTPNIYRARVDITDADAESDFDNVMANAPLELGAAAAKHVDTAIATLFSSVTGGTIGSGAGSTITWQYVTDAYAILNNAGIPAGAPIFCALHPFQWSVLLAKNSIAAATVAVAPGYQDRLTAAPNFFSIPQFQGITFVVDNAIAISGTASYGCIYVPQAFAVDTRKRFNVRPQRDESQELTELNASMWYVAGTYRPAFAVALYTKCATPTGS
jgi:hypothetical protein